MRTKERTPFGERLKTAREHAGLTQKELADAVGLKQSGIAEAERVSQGTTKTVQIAKVLGVRAEWLADGEGPMLDGDPEPSGPARTVASEQVAHFLVGKPAASDYRTIALTLAAALKESGTEVTVEQFVKLLEATYAKLRPE
jgi:transcriptional regulator with XRE-family HTH domain